MSSYFDDEDNEYNSDEEKSIQSEEDKIYSSKKKKGVTKVKSSNPLQNIINSDEDNDENEEDNDNLDEEIEDDEEEDEDDEEEFDGEDLPDDDEEKGIEKESKKQMNIPLFEYENQPEEEEGEDEGSDDDEDEDNNELYLKKFDRELNSNFIQQTHPESQRHNYDEIENLAKVFRNKDGHIVDDLHQTNPYLTKYEKTKILGLRAKQINAGALPFVDVPEKVIDGYTIAQLELKEKKMPFIIRRPLPCGASEYWHLQDLEDLEY